ncbi:MAG: VWA domain-containing protein [Acidobacteriota bacterium]
MRRFLRACLFILTLAMAVATANALQSPEPEFSKPLPDKPSNVPTVRVQTNLVLIPVSVRDASEQPVTNLRMQDFAVRENDAAVKLEHFGRPELSRLDLVLVFDLTSSLWYYFDLIKEAASQFIKTLYRDGDVVSIIGISSEPKVLLQRTESLPAILKGLNELPRFGAATAFFDAVIQATGQFPRNSDPETRRVLVVLSDGEDNLSRSALEDALEHLQKTDTLFYSINPGATVNHLNRVSERGQKFMEKLADQTGGSAFLADNLKNLSDIYNRIAEELQVQYLIGYNAPESSDEESFRGITVCIPDRPDLHVRARKGYYSDRAGR